MISSTAEVSSNVRIDTSIRTVPYRIVIGQTHVLFTVHSCFILLCATYEYVFLFMKVLLIDFCCVKTPELLIIITAL